MRVLRQADRALFRHLRARTHAHEGRTERKAIYALTCSRGSLQWFNIKPALAPHLHEVLQLAGLHAEAVQLAVLAQGSVHARVFDCGSKVP